MYLLAGLLAALVLAFGLFGWRMHSRGWDAATDHYNAVVAAALAANATQAATIKELQAANAAFANAAAMDEAKAQAAVAQTKADAQANAKALAAAQARLREAEHAHEDARTWAADRVPDAVLGALGVRQADRPN